MAAAAVPFMVAGGKKVAQGVSKAAVEALTADLAVIRWEGKTPRKSKRRPSPTPPEYEVHINPAAIGMTAMGLAAAVWALQLRVSPTEMEIAYGKFIWPSDGTDASKVKEASKLGTPPTRQIGSDDVWKIYTGGFPNPYEVVPAGTEGAVLTTVPIMETATIYITETKTERRMAVKERQGFLGSGLGTVVDDGKWWTPWITWV